MPLRDLCKIVFKEGTYDFVAPKDVLLIGSFLTQTQIYNSSDALTSCDLGLEMPAELFNDRDFLNYRYFIKKNMYMAHVHSQLSTLKKYAATVKFEFLAESNAIYNPIMCVVFESEGFEIRLHLLPPSSSFRKARFNPSQANIRKEFFLKNLDPNGDLAALSDENGSNETDELTPLYNADMLADLTARENNDYLKKTLNDAKSVLEAIKLLKLWLHKRGLNKGSGCFDNFSLSMFVAHLLTIRQINPFMSRYQIFRIVLLNLSMCKK